MHQNLIIYTVFQNKHGFSSVNLDNTMCSSPQMPWLFESLIYERILVSNMIQEDGNNIVTF